MQLSNLSSAHYFQHLNSPIGWLKISASQDGVTAIDFDSPPANKHPDTPNTHSQQCAIELEEYFSGSRQYFTVPLTPQGTTFQLNVWCALQKIPFGETCSYLDIANAISNPKAVRAVGGANGRNPIPIIIPCHRVIGRDGTLVGFSGGMEKKIWLLQHEGVLESNTVAPQGELF